MIVHLFKLIWNKKKQNFLLMLEMLISFLILFAVFTLVVYYFQNYNQPTGFNYDNVWSIKYADPEEMKDKDSIAAFNAGVKQMIKSMPEVEDVSFSSVNIPFGDANIGTGFSYNKKDVEANRYIVDDDYKKTLRVSLIEGRWFSNEDNVAIGQRIVINESLKKDLFGQQSAIGKFIDFGGNGADQFKPKIIGVINDLKDKGDFVSAGNGIYLRRDTGNQENGGAILVKVKPGTDAVFENRLYKSLSNSFKSTSIDIRHLENDRKLRNTQAIAPMIILVVVAGFFIINVALGLFGVLWYNINKRRSEIGLRRAVGATGASISRQLIGETLVLSTFTLIVGSFFAVQFPLLNVFDLPASVYLAALILAILFIYLLVIVCSFYPGKQAAAIYPAVALHED